MWEVRPPTFGREGAFEKNCGCLGISCSDVGGLYDESTSNYIWEQPRALAEAATKPSPLECQLV